MLILGDFLRPFWVGIIGHFVMLIKSQYVRTFLGAKNADDCQMEAVPSWVPRAWPVVSGPSSSGHKSIWPRQVPPCPFLVGFLG